MALISYVVEQTETGDFVVTIAGETVDDEEAGSMPVADDHE